MFEIERNPLASVGISLLVYKVWLFFVMDNPLGRCDICN